MISEFRDALRTVNPARYLWETRYYIAAAVLLFVLCIVAGAAFYSSAPAETRDQDFKQAAEQVTRGKSSDPAILTVQVFANNVLVALMQTAGGLLWGIVPLYGTVMNAKMIGLLYAELVAYMGFADGSIYMAAGILPHGVFELAAYWTCVGMGLKLGAYAITGSIADIKAWYRNTPKQERDAATATRDVAFYGQLANIAVVFVAVIVPLLAVAAVVECYVTPIILGLV